MLLRTLTYLSGLNVHIRKNSQFAALSDAARDLVTRCSGLVHFGGGVGPFSAHALFPASAEIYMELTISPGFG